MHDVLGLIPSTSWRREDREFKAILGYVAGLMPDLTT